MPDNVQEKAPESVQDRVLRVIATTRRVPLDTVRPDSTFEELGIDSLDRINILFELEGEFDIEIDDEQAQTGDDPATDDRGHHAAAGGEGIVGERVLGVSACG